MTIIFVFCLLVLFGAGCGAQEDTYTGPEPAPVPAQNNAMQPWGEEEDPYNNEPDPDLDRNNIDTHDMGWSADFSDEPESIVQRCFPHVTQNGNSWANYDQFGPRLHPSCAGTRHQVFGDIEKVVFLGDAILRGSDTIPARDSFRSQLADELAMRFDLQKPSYVWQLGEESEDGWLESGDFRLCARSSALLDDLTGAQGQLERCFPQVQHERTLIIITAGGFDLVELARYASTQGHLDGKTLEEVGEVMMQAFDDTLRFLQDEERFVGGSAIVFANPYEFTDGTGRVDACPAAAELGLGDWQADDDFMRLIRHFNEWMMMRAVEFGVDMVFLMENFCGHGFVATGRNADESARCYLGPNTPRYFDDTCIHPNAAGHDALARLFGRLFQP